MDGCTDARMHERTDARMHGWMHGWADACTDGTSLHMCPDIPIYASAASYTPTMPLCAYPCVCLYAWSHGPTLTHPGSSQRRGQTSALDLSIIYYITFSVFSLNQI